MLKMIKVLGVCYLIFLVVITVFSIYAHPNSRDFPVWMMVSEAVVVPLGFVSMLLFTFSYKPKFYTWIWKIVPILLVGHYLIEWYFDFIIFKEPNDTPQFVAGVTVIGLFLLLPLFYSSFKFGYSEDDM